MAVREAEAFEKTEEVEGIPAREEARTPTLVLFFNATPPICVNTSLLP